MIQATDTNSPLWSPLIPVVPLTKGDSVAGGSATASESDFVNHLWSDNLLHGARFVSYNPSLLDRARKMRKEMTFAEKIMWKEIIPWITKYRILRQRPIHHYIADFYCPKLKVVIEVDGDSHSSEEAQKYDKRRTEALRNYGIQVIRYKNEDVIQHTQRVRKDLQQQLETREKDI